jgi:hypothetical protein
MRPEDYPTYIHLRALLDAFEEKVQSYCFDLTTDTQEKIRRVNLISAAIKDIPAPGLGIAAPEPDNPPNYGCPPGTVHDGGVCVDLLLDVNWGSPSAAPQPESDQ